jgi:hypothetical protein
MTKGYGQGGSPRQGTMVQRDLLERLKNLIDAASAKGAGIGRDNAKAELRAILKVEHWQSEFILYNLGVKRCRYLRSIGMPVSSKHMFASEADVERIKAWSEG